MIKLVNVSKYYSSNNVIALGLRKVNLELHRNEFVAIVGESGSGKTTLLNVISGIDSYEDGEMYVNGHETSYFSVSDMENYRKKYVAFVFQSYNLIDSYTVLQNVEAPLILSGYPKEKVKERATEIIRRVGLSDHIHHKATKLSGGQKQRVVIARALAKDCPIIAADEPTGNLDSASAKQIIELLSEISKEKLVIIVTHDFSQVEAYATRKIRIFDGEIVEDRNLKKVDKLDLPTIPDTEQQIRFIDHFKIAVRNLLAVPKKTLLMVIVFTFFSFFVALAYGAYQIVMNETTSNYNYHFSNTNPNRIVLRHTDKSIFDADDLEALEDYGIVEDIVAFDYVLDQRLRLITDDFDADYFNGYYLPLSLIDEDDLSYGEMPDGDYEIIYAANDYEISYYADQLPITLTNQQGNDDETYTIVGLVNNTDMVISDSARGQSYMLVGNHLMEQARKRLYFQYIDNMEVINRVDGETLATLSNYQMIIDETIADDTIYISGEVFMTKCEGDLCTYNTDIVLEDFYRTETFESISLIFDRDKSDYYNALYMNSDTLDSFIYDDVYQVSLLTSTDIGVNSLVSTLQRQRDGLLPTYKVLYPYDSEAAEEFEALLLLLTNIGMIVLNVAVLLGSTLITYVIFRAIINTKLGDYAIYRTIGANQNTIKTFIYTENLLVVVLSYAIFLAINLSVKDMISQDTILYALKVFDLWSYLVFFVLLIIMSLIISRRYTNKIFSETVQTTLKTNLE